MVTTHTNLPLWKVEITPNGTTYWFDAPGVKARGKGYSIRAVDLDNDGHLERIDHFGYRCLSDREQAALKSSVRRFRTGLPQELARSREALAEKGARSNGKTFPLCSMEQSSARSIGMPGAYAADLDADGNADKITTRTRDGVEISASRFVLDGEDGDYCHMLAPRSNGSSFLDRLLASFDRFFTVR